MITYEVGVQFDGRTEDAAEIFFGTIANLKVLHIEFVHRIMSTLYVKDLEVVEDHPGQPDIIRLKYNLVNGTRFINIRFGAQRDKQEFMETAFRNRTDDSGMSSTTSSSSSSSNTPSPPE
ncbi:hypothetical protein QE152_g35761 [Popillia japonica]|uniref:Uncharacterized protein n=1 Tax=Popillia japonica TaxID=7064 RepID=A0AAW1IFD9_POPJA